MLTHVRFPEVGRHKTDGSDEGRDGQEDVAWTMDRRIYLKGAEDLDYVVGIIEQPYKNVL
ncbi:hypothetical protein QTH90_23780 [Variovorax sp. J2P1-59]|uniref:hypothetical protein n=1 Tax=Variovorax flavidus TaxID=3053501 RepID=UPI002576AD67|nr:hypothetical protein [Variovorax sp. J2P1-59]MDM0077448.1 hypothetical protein [Variovorax sp. J2P1-59]